MKNDKCIIEIKAKDLGNGEIEVESNYEGNVILLASTLANAIYNMENTDMDIVFKLLIGMMAEKFEEKLKEKINGK